LAALADTAIGIEVVDEAVVFLSLAIQPKFLENDVDAVEERPAAIRFAPASAVF